MIEFGAITLLSKNPRQMAEFISFLFDTSFSLETKDSYSILVWDQKIIFKEGKVPKGSHINYDLISNSHSEIEELKQKIEFFYYKNDLKHKAPLLYESELRFFDPDNRLWLVLVPLNLSTHLADNTTQDVRHY